MKKRVMKILGWDHFSQMLWIISTIPNFYYWWHGKASMFGMLISGFNLGMAAGWGYYLSQRKRTDWWMERAMRPWNAPCDHGTLNLKKC